MRLSGLLPALLLAGAGVASLDVGGSACDRERTEQEAALVLAAKDAELHGLVVSQPAVSVLDRKSVKAWPKLLTTLRDSKENAVVRVREYMPSSVLKLAAKPELLADLEYLESPPDPRNVRESDDVCSFKSDIVSGLRQAIDDRGLYDEKWFKELALDDEVKRYVALGQKRTVGQSVRLNWGLLQAAFPGSMPELPPAFQTVRVQIRGEKNVVLVLSSYNTCLWDIDVTPGSRVSGVLLCGYCAQELKLSENPIKDVPIVYRAGHALDGAPTDRQFQHLDGNEGSGLSAEEKLNVRKRFEAAIWKLTGKSAFVSIQRDSSAKLAGYFVPPKEKK